MVKIPLKATFCGRPITSWLASELFKNERLRREVTELIVMHDNEIEQLRAGAEKTARVAAAYGLPTGLEVPKPPAQDEFEGQKGFKATQPTLANDIQVGGAHYRSEYQHWDFVHDLDLDYWQACATKYITRWRKKNGLEDLRKAPHYILKRAELVTQRFNTVMKSHGTSEIMQLVLRLGRANDLDAADVEAIWLICIGDWQGAIVALDNLIDQYSPKAKPA